MEPIPEFDPTAYKVAYNSHIYIYIYKIAKDKMCVLGLNCEQTEAIDSAADCYTHLYKHHIYTEAAASHAYRRDGRKMKLRVIKYIQKTHLSSFVCMCVCFIQNFILWKNMINILLFNANSGTRTHRVTIACATTADNRAICGIFRSHATRAIMSNIWFIFRGKVLMQKISQTNNNLSLIYTNQYIGVG